MARLAPPRQAPSRQATPRRTPPRSSATQQRPPSYRGSLSIGSFLIACFIFLLLATSERRDLAALLHTLQALPTPRPDALSATDQHLLAQVIVIPMLGALLAYVCAALGIRFLRVWLYARGLHGYVLRRMQAGAPLLALGVGGASPRVTRLDAAAQPPQPLDTILRRVPHVVLLGADGTGKTTTLLAQAATLTNRRARLGQFVGAKPLPVLIPLGTYAEMLAEAQQPLVEYLTRQVAIFGSTGLVARLPRMLRRGRILLLCDGLDDVPPGERAAVCRELAALAKAPEAKARMLIACQLEAFEQEVRGFAALHGFARVALAPLTEEQVALALRRAAKTRVRTPAGAAEAATRRPARTAVLAELDAVRLHGAAHTPALLAALVTLWRAPDPLPVGRGELLQRYAEVLCQRAANQSVSAERIGQVLGALAASLCAAGTHLLPTPPRATLGDALVRWFAAAPPVTPLDAQNAPLPLPLRAEAEAVCRAALRVGILQRTADSEMLAFVNPLIEAACASRWLASTDDGIGRLTAELLRTEWALPLLLWAGALPDAAPLATRLLQLADTPESSALRAGLPTRDDVLPAALALATLTLVEGLSSQLARPDAAPAARQQLLALAEQHLRDTLDPLSRYRAEPADADRVAGCLSEVEAAGGAQVLENIVALVRLTELNRLVRAQLITLLGVLPSPTACAVLVELLAESDPILREAVTQACIVAGAPALDSLREALHSPNERIRSRAGEVLTAFGGSAIATAIAALDGPDGGQRATAAHTLGSLRADQATDALIQRLGDSERAVRVAVAHALGRIATPAAIDALRLRATDPDAELRASVAQALGATRDPALLDTLLPLLDDGDEAVRAAVARALSLLGDASAIPALQQHRTDPDIWVQNAVVAALRTLGYRIPATVPLLSGD